MPPELPTVPSSCQENVPPNPEWLSPHTESVCRTLLQMKTATTKKWLNLGIQTLLLPGLQRAGEAPLTASSSSHRTLKAVGSRFTKVYHLDCNAEDIRSYLSLCVYGVRGGKCVCGQLSLWSWLSLPFHLHKGLGDGTQDIKLAGVSHLLSLLEALQTFLSDIPFDLASGQ